MRRWWRALKPAEQVAAFGVLVALVVGVATAVPTYLALGGESQPVSDPPPSRTPLPEPTPPPSGTPGASPSPSASSPAATSSPPPTSAPPPTTAPPPPPSPTPPVRFAITSAKVVPNCSDISGTGDRPAGGRTAVVFVRVVGHLDYFYEQPLHFDPTRQTWQANRVVVGDSTSAGQSFELHVYVVSDEYAHELARHNGTPYPVRNVPGERLTWTTVKRDDRPGNC